MKKKGNKEVEGIEVHFSPDADETTKQQVMKVVDLFQGPLFAKLVREAVEDMIFEGKLAYDLETDEFDVPEDIVKRWAARMEKEDWGNKKKKK